MSSFQSTSSARHWWTYDADVLEIIQLGSFLKNIDGES